MDIFIKKNDRVTVEVYAWSDEAGNIDAASDKKDVPKNATEVDVVKFVCRRPNNSDSSRILGSAGFSSETGAPTNIMEFQNEALRTLLVEIETDGEKLTAKQRTIDNLHPAVARAAVAGLLEQVSI